MYNLYLNILKAFINEKALWVKYKDSIDLKYLREYFPELHKVYLSLFKVYDESTSTVITPTDLQAYFLSFYPASSGSEYESIFKALSHTVDPATQDSASIQVYLESIYKRGVVSSLVDVAVGYVEGGVDDEKLRAHLTEVENAINVSPKNADDKDESEFVTLSENLEDEVKGEQGYRWSLPSLNGALGSLRKGDFGFIVARPETGKTTFLANQAAYFSTQTPGSLDGDRSILWINNEERSSKVGFRIRQSLHALQKKGMVLPAGSSFDSVLSRIKLPKDLVLQKIEVERLAASLNPSLIIIDQLDKIKGFEGDRYDLELKEAYQWARELASKYGPVIGVCQAGASAENKKWVGMGDVDSSKTGKQGEADWILGVGKTDNEDSSHVRYFFLSKNKLLGDTDSDPARRHDKWTVKILPEEAMYEDF